MKVETIGGGVRVILQVFHGDILASNTSYLRFAGVFGDIFGH